MKKNSPPSSPAHGRRYATMKAAGEYVGVSQSTIRQWITEGRITGYKMNERVYRIDLNELDCAMEPFGGAA